MSDRPAAPASKLGPIQFYAVSVLLMGNFLYRTLVPADEYPHRAITIITMMIDAGLIAGLVSGRKLGPQALFWIALLCGVGLFLIRLHGDASWYTGHWNYSLGRR